MLADAPVGAVDGRRVDAGFFVGDAGPVGAGIGNGMGEGSIVPPADLGGTSETKRPPPGRGGGLGRPGWVLSGGGGGGEAGQNERVPFVSACRELCRF